MGKKQDAKKAAAKGKQAAEEAQSVVGKAVDAVSGTTERGKAALGGLVSRGKGESQAALERAKAAVDELVRLGVVQADRAQEAVHTVYERGTSKIGLGGDDGPAPATQEDVAALRRGDRGAAGRAQGVQARAGAGVDGPHAGDPRTAAAKPAAKPATARTTAARGTAAKPAARRTTAKPAATPSPDVVPPAPGSTGASGATSTGRRPAGGAS